jgi:glycerol kinase
VAGDQQAALFGQRCFEPGMVKNTYGTGCFMLMNIGRTARLSSQGLLTTIAWSFQNEVTYALEGAVFIAGAAVQWLRDEMHMIDSSADSEYFARKADDKEMVYVVPAFAGLGAPYWDMYARGAIFGLTRDTGKEDIIRATLESLAFQTRDVLDAMTLDAQTSIQTLLVDGGAGNNDFLMQFQSDILQRPVVRPANVEATALGAARMAAIGAGFMSWEEFTNQYVLHTTFHPTMEPEDADRRYKGWKKAVKRTMHWTDDEP